MKKLLSIVVPCYNSQDYLSHAVESPLPGGDEVEILIIDDGSTDRTAELADAFAAKEGYGTALIEALKKLNRDALSDLNPHPLIVKLEYSHPTLSQRIDAISGISLQ